MTSGEATPARSFDLTAMPWLRLRDHGGTIDEVSLRDALAGAHNFRGLAGEVPTQDVAVLRLLLSILRRALIAARTTTDWKGLWDRKRFDTVAIDDYLNRHHERFDLLHPETPFYQVAGLHTAKGEMTELSRIIADVPAGHPYFTTRTGAATKSMSYAEAARWIVHAQAFDPSGIKSGAVGDDRVKGGKGYPIGIAWCGWLGLVVAEGANLFETLMLNLALGKSLPDNDLPVWERPPQGPGVETRPAAPTGPVDLLTWQSRRILLDHDGEQVTGVLIANGDPLHPRDRFREEFMTGWRRSEAQEKALKSAEPVFMPRAHVAERAVWRGLEGLLATTDNANSTRAGRWLEWLNELRVTEILPSSYPLRLRTVGMQYGAQSSVIDDITSDVLPLTVAVLSDVQLKALAIDGVRDVDAAVRVFGRFADELAQASGADRDLCATYRSDAREHAYAALDAPYRRWVRSLAPDLDRDVVRPAWQRQVRQEVTALARELLGSTSTAAWAGLPVGPGREHPLNAATATNWFYINLRKALPAAYDQPEGAAS